MPRHWVTGSLWLVSDCGQNATDTRTARFICMIASPVLKLVIDNVGGDGGGIVDPERVHQPCW